MQCNGADSECKREASKKKFKTENKFAKAKEMRQCSLETFCQVKKHKESYADTYQKKRSSLFSQDYRMYFNEKSEREFQLR